ncbi:MAG: hypothetical protein K8U03_22655 [Planctomycetia bacterium]|nr:hypothetical protein [Planctomycetia bacterium]
MNTENIPPDENAEPNFASFIEPMSGDTVVGKHDDEPELKQLVNISDIAAEGLISDLSNRYLSTLKILSDVLVESWSGRRETLDIRLVKSLSDAFAENLSKYQDALYLSHSIKIPAAAVESLSRVVDFRHSKILD